PHRKHCECNNVENVLGAVLTGKQPFSGRTAGFSRNLHTDLIRALAFGPRFGQLAVPERCELTMFLLQLFERLKFDLRVVLLDLLLYLSLFGLSFGASNQGASMRSGRGRTEHSALHLRRLGDHLLRYFRRALFLPSALLKHHVRTGPLLISRTRVVERVPGDACCRRLRAGFILPRPGSSASGFSRRALLNYFRLRMLRRGVGRRGGRGRSSACAGQRRLRSEGVERLLPPCGF